MDPPDTPSPPTGAAASSEDSPVFDFIKKLSPIATSKPRDAAPTVQPFKPSDLAHISSIFTSPHVNSQKGSKISIRNTSAQEGLSPYCHITRIGTSSYYVKQSEPITISSKNCNIDRSLSQSYHDSPENASILRNHVPQHIQLSTGTLGSDKREEISGKTDHATAQKHAKLSFFEHSGLDKMKQSTSGMDVQERDLAKKHNDELTACNWDYFNTQCGSSVVPTSDLRFETAAQLVETPKDDVMPSKSFVPIAEPNLENSRRKLFHGSTDCYIQSAVDNSHVYCNSRGKGVATNYVSGIPPCPSQSQLVPDHQFCDAFEVPSGYMTMNHSAVSQHLRGLHRRSLFDEKATMPTNAVNSGQENLKRKRQKWQNGDEDPCKRCSCKKSKCLKLYCECFAAKVYCSESCSCRGCFNDHSHEETVLCTRNRVESRNPLAFAPKVIRTSAPGLEFGEDSNATPSSSRHKRGCNCKKSYCLKKYCECFQSGVGCSMSCRCESCKNAFGIRKGIQLLDIEEIERVDKKKKAHLKEEQPWMRKLHAFGETCSVPSTENLFSTPSIESRRALALPPSECSKPILSSTITSSQPYSPTSTDVLPSPYGSYTQMILGNDLSDMQQGDSSCTASFKVVSPKKKRVSPLRKGNSLSPMCSRQLVLKSIPSLPSLTGDANSELQ